jgi:curved DNA-binding protein CbpA
MAPEADPYRTLGLSRDATLDEVRRAYRRLAKANHPDAAGEAALPRFLAIQAAYDRIAGPDARARRPGAARPTGPRRAWDAERDRTDATYRAYGGRARRTRPTGGPGSTRGPSAERPSGERPPGTRPPRPERPPNKATLGSTSYDGADAEPLEPDWGGASWYGTTSGTYWTLNPKEYADPRKHGPEYQARARRELGGLGADDGPEAAVPPGPADAPEAEPGTSPRGSHAASGSQPYAEPTAGPRTTAATPSEPATDSAAQHKTPPATHTTSSWWEATAGHPPRPDAQASAGARPGERRPGAAPAAGRPPAARPDAAPAARPDAVPGISADALLDAIRTWLDDAHPGTIGRVARALVGWAPIALGIGWLGGEISGCGRFAAGCDDTVATSAWIAQIAALLILIVVGRLARIASVATLATLAAAIPAALLLSATGNPDDAAAGRLALSGLLVISWVVGLVFGVVREIRGTGTRRRGSPA